MKQLLFYLVVLSFSLACSDQNTNPVSGVDTSDTGSSDEGNDEDDDSEDDDGDDNDDDDDKGNADDESDNGDDNSAEDNAADDDDDESEDNSKDDHDESADENKDEDDNGDDEGESDESDENDVKESASDDETIDESDAEGETDEENTKDETTDDSEVDDGTDGDSDSNEDTDAATDTGTGEEETGEEESIYWGDKEPPSRIEGGAEGFATRYWDCCKPHCGWDYNSATPIRTCDVDNNPINDVDAESACGGMFGNVGPAHTCWDLRPWAVGERLAYGFAAVSVSGDICGRCYQLDFTGPSYYVPENPGAKLLGEKTMIVQATNVGGDVDSGQFDVLIPGGGVGQFDACTNQWGTADLGVQYGGFLDECFDIHGTEADNQVYKDCVWDHCQRVFNKDGMEDLMDGCYWFVHWYEAADNPILKFAEVECPQELVERSGMSPP